MNDWGSCSGPIYWAFDVGDEMRASRGLLPSGYCGTFCYEVDAFCRPVMTKRRAADESHRNIWGSVPGSELCRRRTTFAMKVLRDTPYYVGFY